MNKAVYLKIASIVVFAIGLFFLAGSKINITGAVIGISNIPTTASFIFGIIYMSISILLMAAIQYNDPTYESIATRMYETLGNKRVWGHHTETIDDVISWVRGGGSIKTNDIKWVIEEEIKRGHLKRIEKHPNSITINGERANLDDILDNYTQIKPDVKKRLEDLRDGIISSGVR